MLGRSSKKKEGPEDLKEAAFRVLSDATGERQPEPEGEKNPAAVALGRLGGAKGGRARAAKLTPEERTRIAKRASRARWSKRPRR